MKTQILTIANSKGGCGKSTICTQLAVRLAQLEHRVLLIDADPQQTVSSWAKAAPDNIPFSVTVISLSSFGEKLHREIEKHVGNYDFIIVDTPGSLEALSAQSALLVSNLAILPLMPSPADVWATRAYKEIIERARAINEELKAVVLPNRISRTALSSAVLKELETFEIPVMESQLGGRTAFQEAMVSGVSVFELGRNAKTAAGEVATLTEEVLSLTGGKQ